MSGAFKLIAGVAFVLVATACNSSTSSTTTPSGGDAAASADCPAEGEEFETAKLYIEHNATDADTGVHGLFGGAAWSELCIWDPKGVQVLVVDPLAQLNDLTVADLFFESREPENSEVSIADIEAAFPEGEYQVSGTDFEGTPRMGTALFTHDIPVEPTIVSPGLAEDAETAVDAVVPMTGLVVEWEPVTETLIGDDVTVTGYEVIVTKEEHEDPNGWSRPVYDVHVAPTATSLSVPDEFLEPDTVYELEVLVLEESGNQTISVGFLLTASG
ncbi:MAG: fibronectin type III domain-containing protein [Acidimicrobiia bacterium]|nr:fibronectin type III domain-containing protein [Acidimicrobiia bacterium]